MSTRFCLYFYPTGNSLTTFKGKTVFQLGDSMNNLYFIQKQLFFWKYYVEILFSVQRKLIFSLKSFFFFKNVWTFQKLRKNFWFDGEFEENNSGFLGKNKIFLRHLIISLWDTKLVQKNALLLISQEEHHN